VLLPVVSIGFLTIIWAGKRYRMNPIRCLTKCPRFAGYAAILVSSGRHGESSCRKRGAWHTDVTVEKHAIGLTRLNSHSMIKDILD
jgi:hypothetical protein